MARYNDLDMNKWKEYEDICRTGENKRFQRNN